MSFVNSIAMQSKKYLYVPSLNILTRPTINLVTSLGTHKPYEYISDIHVVVPMDQSYRYTYLLDKCEELSNLQSFMFHSLHTDKKVFFIQICKEFIVNMQKD